MCCIIDGDVFRETEKNYCAIFSNGIVLSASNEQETTIIIIIMYTVYTTKYVLLLHLLL